MHFEILVEDASGKIALDAIVPKILGSDTAHTFRIHPYKGVGRIPAGLNPNAQPHKRILLDQLPRILKGYGRSLLPRDQHAVIVLVDSDRKNCRDFKQELLALLDQCNPAPRALFRIAVEEMEAWFLGDAEALKRAYPNAKDQVLRTYVQDAVCGTWELLADAIYPGGHTAMKAHGYPLVGQVKCAWATAIAPHLSPKSNRSPSFRAFCGAFTQLISRVGPHEGGWGRGT